MKSHYEILEVDQSATDKEIKHSWARLVRKFPADNHPETNRLLNEAKTCLLDSVARSEYDERLNHGDELDEMFEEGREAFAEEDYEDAIEILKELLVIGPSRNDARWILAQCFEQLEEYASAERHYVKLTENEPKRGMFAYGLADLYRSWGEQVTAKFVLADRWYVKAIELEKFNSQFYRGRAQNFIAQKQFDKAESCLTDAINADGKKDIDDIDTLVMLLMVYLLANKHYKFEYVATQVKECVQGNNDAANYAAFKMLEFVEMFANASKDWETAAKIVKSVRSFCSDLRELEDYAVNVERKGIAATQIKLLQDANIQPEIVKGAITLYAFPNLGVGDLDREILGKLAAAMKTWPYVDVMKAWRLAQQQFPELCKLVEKNLLPLLETSNRTLTAQHYPGFNTPPVQPSAGQSQVESTSSDTGWIVWVIFGIIAIGSIISMSGGCG